MIKQKIIFLILLIILISGCTISMESGSGQPGGSSTSSTTVTGGSSEVETSELFISSIPSGADVYVDRALVGVTPISVELTVGSYTITVEKEGYYEYSGRVQVLSGRRNSVSAILTSINEDYVPPAETETEEETPPSEEETPSTTPIGALMIDSSPIGASIYINGIYYGLTPKIVSSLAIADYTVTIEKEGYYPNATRIRVNANVLTPYTFILVTMPVTEPEGLLRCNLTIDSDPAGAIVYLNNSVNGLTPSTTFVNHGYYSIRFVKDGYNDYSTFKRVDCIEETFSVNLTELPHSRLSIKSIPSGANVYMNNTFRGITNMSTIVYYGNYSVTIVKNGYINYTTIKDINNDTYEIIAVMSNRGNISISSSPSGANIYIDGEFRGVTPLLVNLSIGVHNLKFNMTGFEDFITNVNIDSPIDYFNARLIPLPTASLTITTLISGASVYVDGHLEGTTPITVSNLLAGSYDVYVTKSGYCDTVVVKTVTAGSNSLSITQPIICVLYSIDSDPTGAMLYINDVYKGITPLNNLNLASGTYNITLIKRGYESLIMQTPITRNMNVLIPLTIE